MNKKLIAIGIAAVLAAPFAAQAGVEVYGQARASVDFTSNNDPTPTNSDSAIAVSSNASRLGFKGDEDLGNGLSVLWQIEQGVALDTGVAFSPRQTFVGLAGGFGTVLAGKLDTPDKVASGPLDIFADTRADFNALVGGDVRADNVIAYISPDLGGAKILAAYIPSTSNDNLIQTQDQNDQSAISLAGTYSNGPVYAALAYESISATSSSGNDDATDMKLGGSFNFGQGTTVGALFEQIDSGVVGTDSYNVWHINVAHAIGNTTLKAAYSNADETTSGADNAATQFSLGVSQALTKNTEVYALYTSVSNDPNSARGPNGVGAVAGEDASAFSIGINHKFSSK